MFVFWHFDLFYFFAQFLANKKSSEGSFLACFCNYWCNIWSHLAQTWSQWVKKNPKHYLLVLRNVSKIYPILVEISKILKIALFVSNFIAPNTVRSSQNWSIMLH